MQLLPAHRQAADTLAGRREHGVRHGRTDRRHAGLAHAGRVFRRFDDMHLDDGHLVQAQHVIAVEVGLLDLSIGGREPIELEKR